MVGANYAFAKNIVGAVEYYDLDGKDAAETNSVEPSSIHILINML